MTRLTEINLHGRLGEEVGKKWNLAINSVSEAFRAIEILSKHKFYKFLSENDKKGVRYRVLINGNDFTYEEKPTLEKPETILNTELTMNFKKLDSIDVIPVLEGAKSGLLAAIAGVLLIIVGILIVVGTLGGGTALGAGVIIAGLGLLAAGVINLISSPPKFDDFRNIDSGGASRPSYLFNGPENITQEGGPVPVGYGRLIIGSQVISASYEISQTNTSVLTQ